MLVFDVFVVFVLSMSYVALATFYGGHFLPFATFWGGLLITSLIVFFRNKGIKFDRHFRNIIILVAVACIFRAEPFFHIQAGQDQGVYVNMAACYFNEGKPFVQDKIIANVSNTDFLKIYRNDNMGKRSARSTIVDKYEGFYTPGLYVKNYEKGVYVFQFYHLHPLLMSVAGWLFGLKNMVLSLVILSVASVVAFYYLAFELSKCTQRAFLAGLLLAINPLHAYFSKFPASENVALFFSLVSFYYLTRFWNTRKDENRYVFFNLIISALTIGAMFFTRISGFMYAPFYYFLFSLALYYYKDNKLDNKTCRVIIIYCISVLSLLLLSLVSGYFFSFPYSYDILRRSFRFLGKNAIRNAALLCVTPFLCITAICYSSILRKVCSRIMSWVRNNYAWLFIIIFCLGAYKIYTLAYTDAFLESSWLSKRFKIAGRGFSSVRYSSLYTSIQFLSPMMFGAFIATLFNKNKNDVCKNNLLFFLLCFWGFILLKQWVIPYKYYYARYLVSEIIPYTMLFVSVYFFKDQPLTWLVERTSSQGTIIFKKVVFCVFVLLTISYSVVYSAAQFNKKEMDGVDESLSYLCQHFTKNDLLILPKSNFELLHFIKMPIGFYYDRPNITLSDYNNIDTLDFLTGHYLSVFLLHKRGVQVDEKLWTKVCDFQYDRNVMKKSPFIPQGFTNNYRQLSLYKLNDENMSDVFITKTGRINPVKYKRKKGFYPGDNWTNGDAMIFGLEIPLTNRDIMVIKTKGHNPLKNDSAFIQSFNFKINNVRLEFIKQDNNDYLFKIPNGIDLIKEISFHSGTFIPKDMGINEDKRVLGIDIAEIYFMYSK